jgi:hypothetical protein
MNTEPYCNYPPNNWRLMRTDISYLDKLKPTNELIDFFDKKYGVDKYENKKDTILLT